MAKKTDKKPVETAQDPNKNENTPQIFTVQKDLAGWQFSRRDFLAAAGAVTAAAVTGCAAPQELSPATGVIPPSNTPEPVMVITKTPEPTNTAVPKATKAPTQTPTKAATKTPAPTKTPTKAATKTPTPSPTPAPLAQFVEDVTIPDNTIIEPGATFTKTWRIKNSGHIAWGDGVTLAFKAGDQLGGESPIDVPDVSPGDTIDISVELTAPAEPGIYKGEWSLRTADNFSLTSAWVVIGVASTQAIAPGTEGIQFQAPGLDGAIHTFTLPCGSPIPAGAVCVCNCVAADLPGIPGDTPPDQEGINFIGPSGEKRTMPCGSPIPDGWTCSCNCVAPVCSCVGHCSCNAEGSHYWYPN